MHSISISIAGSGSAWTTHVVRADTAAAQKRRHTTHSSRRHRTAGQQHVDLDEIAEARARFVQNAFDVRTTKPN